MTASPDISDSLPPEAKNWQRTSGNELSREGLARIRARRARTQGLVVHYDIMRPFAKRFEHYANDPAIKELTASGAALTVLTLAPNREVLLEQFLKRAADFVTPEPSRPGHPRFRLLRRI